MMSAPRSWSSAIDSRRSGVYGTGSNATRDSLLVRVEDADGCVGWGETFPVDGAGSGGAGDGRRPRGRDRRRGGRRTRDPDWAPTAGRSARSRSRSTTSGPRRGASLGELYQPRLRDRVEAYASSRGYAGDARRRLARRGAPRPRPRLPGDEVPHRGLSGDRGAGRRREVVRDGPAFHVDGRRERRLRLRHPARGAAPRGGSASLARAPRRPIHRPTHRSPPRSTSRSRAARLETPGGEPPLAAGPFDIIQPDLGIVAGLRRSSHRRRRGPPASPPSHDCNGGCSSHHAQMSRPAVTHRRAGRARSSNTTSARIRCAPKFSASRGSPTAG